MKIFFKFFEKWTTLLRTPMLTNLLILLVIAASFVKNRKLSIVFSNQFRQIRYMLKSDETIYPTILYRYLPNEFPVEVAENQNAAVPRFVQYIAKIGMAPYSSENDHLVMTPEEFWQVIKRQLPEMREQAAAAIENQNREIELLFRQPLLGTPRNKQLLADYCDEFANALNRTVTNGEVFRSLRADIEAYRNGHFNLNSERLNQCTRVKYLNTIMQWCKNEANRRGIDARLDNPDQYSRDVTKFLNARRKNVDSHTKRYLSRIDSHFWSNSNNPNVSLLAKFLFNLRLAPTRVANAQSFTHMMLREFARQQEQNKNASFVIGRPRAGPPFSGYNQLTVPIAQSLRYVITKAELETMVEDGFTVAKYSEIFESLRNDYWRYENAQDENARHEMIPDVERSERKRNLEYRLIQVKATFTIMNCLTGNDWRGDIIDEEYLKRLYEYMLNNIDAQENVNLELEIAENEPVIPVQYTQQPQQPQLSRPEEHHHQQQLYELQPKRQQYKTHLQPDHLTYLRSGMSPEWLVQAMIIGLIPPIRLSEHPSNDMAGEGNSRKYLKTNPPEI